MEKKAYTHPTVTCTIVWLESSMAAASTGAQINPGNAQNNSPYVEDWQTQTGFSNDFDL
ncbi:hypothetical protein [Sphingobacterium deserti]|uniref:Uncharacterized protein n=1 Tax=Sphingobacterium deserti TaxID=1229276 RepID=A0A0B8T154_9SPHI|nr:hypothetical protein [Sphingobacterium deserti]KGE14346.1 hypothetical protein DI53_1960 [Sphingobacterium deserti]